MEELRYVDRRNTNCNKWDGQTGMFGEEGLHAMWVADMDFEAPQCVKKALHDYVETGVYGYYRIPDGYYQSFVDWEEKRHGYKVQREWIRFSPGVVSAFNWMIQIMSCPGDAVIVNTPVYYPFLHAVNNNGRRLVTSDLVNHQGVYTIDFEDFEQKITDHQVKVFILCSPHNPVGRVWKREELKQLFDICRKHQVFVIADEIHQDLVYGENRHVSSQLVGEYRDMMVVIKAPSKTFNLAGGQNSLVVIEDEKLRAKWDSYVNGIRILGGNAFGYVAAEAAYAGGEAWLESIHRQIWENYSYLKKEMKEKLPEAVVSPLEGTYLAWIDLGAYTTRDGIQEWMQKRAHLAVDYGEWFGGERFGTCVRMNLATSLENVKIGVESMIAGRE